MQIEHHMFPCINHCHLPALQPKVEALCLKHGVKVSKHTHDAHGIHVREPKLTRPMAA